MTRHLQRIFSFLILISILSGCSTYDSRIREVRSYFVREDYEAAANRLETFAKDKNKDELLYWMNLGSVYHTQGKYKEAIQAFFKARDLADLKDYTSISEEVGSVVVNDSLKAYKGEDFEKVLIHVYLAMDFALLGNRDDALVECRKVNSILEIMKTKGKRPYEQNGFAKYLAGTLFDGGGEWNDALVDYRELSKWFPNFPYLSGSLLKLADRLQFTQELAEFRKQFPLEKDYRLPKNYGEILLVFEEGEGPVKVPDTQYTLIPRFQRRSYASRYAVIHAAGNSARSQVAFDIEGTAIRELDYKLGAIVGKKLGGTVLKYGLGYGVAKATNSDALGLLTAIVLTASDQADLRHWTFLPAHFQIARLAVPAGKQDIVMDLGWGSGRVDKNYKIWSQVSVKPGEVKILNIRTKSD